MKTPQKLLLAIFAALALCVARPALPSTVGVNLGTGAPPATLGGFTMTEFGPDGRPLFTNVSTVPAPGGGAVGFSPAADHFRIGMGWATWSNGYTGDVYYSNGLFSLTMTLPTHTLAFDFYAEPNPFATFTFTAVDSAVVIASVNGNSGANGFGFYLSPLGGSLGPITISSTVDFSVGEFGICRATPEPFSTLWLALPLAGIVLFRRFRTESRIG